MREVKMKWPKEPKDYHINQMLSAPVFDTWYILQIKLFENDTPVFDLQIIGWIFRDIFLRLKIYI